MSNLSTRVLVAAVYFPLLLISVVHVSLFSALMFVILSLSWFEYLGFQSRSKDALSILKRVALALVMSSPLLFVDHIGLVFFALGFLLQATVVYWVIKGRAFSDLWNQLQFYVFGALYLTGLFASLVFLHRVENGGMEAVWFLIFVVAATDTGAYFAGKSLGRKPFFPWVSPSKTWEGVMGGLLGALLVCPIFYFVFQEIHLSTPSLGILMVLGLVVGICSVFGDLIESLLKRHYGVKDSGSLLAGHGGVLDRFDGLIFAALPLLLIISLSGGFSFDSFSALWTNEAMP